MNERTEPPRFVSIRYFWQSMLGLKSKSWFYDHVGDEGFPQPVDIGSRKMMVLSECIEFMEKLKSAREAKEAKAAGKPPPPVKRRIGRPAAPPKHLRS